MENPLIETLKQISDESAKLLRLRRAKSDLISFVEHMMPNYQTASFHRLIAHKLEAVAEGKIPRLMLFLPPRHGKTTLASRYLPAWYLGRFPDRQIITVSYNYDYAGDIGRDVRNIITSEEYRQVFNTRLAVDSQAANKWHTEKRGAYIAAGIGTGIRGRGAHIAIIDDPHKEDDSKKVRDVIGKWYKGVLYPRLMPGKSGIILIQTRFHEDDLAGRLLADAKKGGDQWDVVRFPAIATDGDVLGRKPGDALWPEAFPLCDLERIRRVITEDEGNREWLSQYQQDPMPESGEFFTRDMFRPYNRKEFDIGKLRIYAASDFAVSGEGDFTVHGIAGVDDQDNLYLLDWWKRKSKPDLWIEVMLDLAQRWKPVKWAVERGQIARSIGPFLEQRMHERRIYFHKEEFQVVQGDKKKRATSIQARMSSGKVFFPSDSGNVWVLDLQQEMLKFDAGTHDDQVDVMGLFGRMLSEMRGPMRTEVKQGDSHWTFGYFMKMSKRNRRGIPLRREAPVTKVWTMDELLGLAEK